MWHKVQTWITDRLMWIVIAYAWIAFLIDVMWQQAQRLI